VGQRRSGKSYILRQVAKQLIDSGVKPENTLFIILSPMNFFK
jgi:predicted AAA+ superfamily ATPase